MTWANSMAALQAWVVAATGLPTANVRWSGQGGMRPVGAWITLQIISESAPNGPDWVDVENVGNTVQYVIRGTRDSVLRVQCFAGLTVGISSSFEILQRLYTYARSPAQRALLEAAEVSIGPISAVKDIPMVIDSVNFEPRATIDVRFFTVVEVIESATYIENVDITGNAEP